MALIGLDGTNLLGFLAALGTLLALDRTLPGVRMSWSEKDYHPEIHPPREIASGSWDKTAVVGHLQEGLRRLEKGNRFPWDNLRVSREEFRRYASDAASAASGMRRREWADFVVGLASDAAGKANDIEDTALRTMSGQGHQHFLGFMRDLCQHAGREQLEKALFRRWTYEDKGRSLRWDPTDDRRYSLRASDPSKGSDKDIPSVWGANRLAFEALACLPCFPMGRILRTTGFGNKGNNDKEGRGDKSTFHWPLWKPAITLPIARSLLGHRAVLDSNARLLRAMGVFAVVCSRRYTSGRYRNFSPASVCPV